jgi:pimeloyl-ACP methyl ester carboxylesterase
MDERVYHVSLPDRRRIACSEYGDPAGRPVIYCHGFPSSRHEALLLHDNAVAEGARVIAIDRPGYGESDYQPGRTILDWPADVAAVADQLELERFALIGVSGGGPYALACAALIPERLSACTLVCALGPIYLDELLATMHWAPRSQLTMARSTPILSHIVFGALTAGILAYWPETVENFRALSAPEVDCRELEKDSIRRILNTTIRDAVRAGARGVRQDLMLYTRPWGIPFQEIRFPVQLWHGEADGTVPVAHTRWYAAHLPRATANYLPNEGH